jgi:hypothetical protein
MQVAAERRFREYRRDLVLDVRQIDLALRRLRRLGREGAHEELDLDETIAGTARNGGELELCFRPPKRNRMKLVLLMDVGGSMDPHAGWSSGCSPPPRGRPIRPLPPLLLPQLRLQPCLRGRRVHEAAAARRADRAELARRAAGGGGRRAHAPGRAPADRRLALLTTTTPRRPASARCAGWPSTSGGRSWLNPEPERFWPRTTIEMIAGVFPMYMLTLDGLGRAVRYLVGGPDRPALV